jgi:hypothetical protein
MVMLSILIVDTLLSWVFIYFQCDYIFSWPFETLTDKAMQMIIGFGITGIVIVYSILDGIRYLPSYLDKGLYLLSVLMMKPILLPVLLPGSCFRSPMARRKNQVRYIHKHEGIEETKFMIAIEESNFLFTFVLAGVSAMSTFIAVCQTEMWAALPVDTMLVSLSYGLFGLTVSVLMYGRKVRPQNAQVHEK